MKPLARHRPTILSTALVLLAALNPSWAEDKVEYQIQGWGRSDPVDLFHFTFQWLAAEGVTSYADQYQDSEWVFASPFRAVGEDCATVTFAPDESQEAIDMVVCDPQAGASVTGTFHLERRLINQQPYAYDPSRPFAFPLLQEEPYVSWDMTVNSVIVEFAVAGNMAALRAAPNSGVSRWTGTLWLIEDNGDVPSQPTMGSIENMLNWVGDRRSYVAGVSEWSSEGISSCEELLYAGRTGQLDQWPQNNKHLKAWPLGGVSIGRTTKTVMHTPADTQHEMVRVPAGGFIMGTDEATEHEQPQHTSFLNAYYIDRYETSVDQYGACVATGACAEPESGPDLHWGKTEDGPLPINGVTWPDADNYCRWAGLRLPTEAEWEKAARGADGRTFPWGEIVDTNKANYGGPYPVVPSGGYPEGMSPYGAMDMAGNMWELVADPYVADAYVQNALFNPAWSHDSAERIVRGGSSHSPAIALQSARRRAIPGESISPWGGFRCARSTEGETAYPRFGSAALQADGAAAGRVVNLQATVVLDRPMEETGFHGMRLSLAPAGVDATLALQHSGGGIYEADWDITIPASGRYQLPLLVSGPDGHQLLVGQVGLSVWPTTDVAIFADGLTDGWQTVERKMELVDLAQTGPVDTGNTTCAIRGAKSFAGWQIAFAADRPIGSVGYVLRFRFHPDQIEATPSRFTVSTMPGAGVNLLELVDLEHRQWQQVQIPLEDFGVQEPVTGISFSGDATGTFLLDDISLVVDPGSPTAVVEQHADNLPSAFVLAQNYPNPFNSNTVIGFSLPTDDHVELAIYNITGQRVTTLIDGPRNAGSYTLAWDGRDADDQSLASGIYLYRLWLGQQLLSRKMLLLR
jgi:formylglycine-generating enzyme required for sulfatase activity